MKSCKEFQNICHLAKEESHKESTTLEILDEMPSLSECQYKNKSFFII